MTVRLSVRREAWSLHISRTAAAVDGLVPVVKGNGYGFGRAVLHPEAAKLAADVCVGTVHELDHVAPGTVPVVLTPTLERPASAAPVLTIGSPAHLRHLTGWHGRVLVKVASSMRRFGVAPGALAALLRDATAARLDVVGAAVHLPLAGDDDAHLAEIEVLLPHVDPALPVWVSHLAPESFARLQDRHPRRTFRLRLGTALWHGDKSFLHLTADVLDNQAARAGDLAGYRARPVPSDGRLVLAGGGSAHGIAPLAGGASPFHFARHRLALLEDPHMHTSMLHVPAGQPAPAVGDRVDVQRPLITTYADEIEWLP